MEYVDLIKGFIFGVSLAIAIGPISIIILRSAIHAGFKSGLLCALGASLADLSFAMAAFNLKLGLINLINYDQAILSVVGSTVLILFGVYMVYTSNSALVAVNKSPSNYLLSTYFLTISSPLAIIGFFGFAIQLHLVHPTISYVSLLSLSIFSGSMLVQVLLVFAGVHIGNITRSTSVIKALNLLSGIVVIAFGFVGFFKFI